MKVRVCIKLTGLQNKQYIFYSLKRSSLSRNKYGKITLSSRVLKYRILFSLLENPPVVWRNFGYSVNKWKSISCKHNTRWQHQSRLKASAFFSLQKKLVVKKWGSLYLGLVMPSSGWSSPITGGFVEYLSTTAKRDRIHNCILVTLGCPAQVLLLMFDTPA